jgi:hypothetical protein
VKILHKSSRDKKMGRDIENCVERREQTRFNVRAGVSFEWQDAEGVEHCGQGVTRDISTKGLFMFADCLPPVKVDVRLEVLFGSVDGTESHLQLEAEAVVLRVEAAANTGILGGFAVLNKCHTLADLAFLSPPRSKKRNEPN